MSTSPTTTRRPREVRPPETLSRFRLPLGDNWDFLTVATTEGINDVLSVSIGPKPLDGQLYPWSTGVSLLLDRDTGDTAGAILALSLMKQRLITLPIRALRQRNYTRRKADPVNLDDRIAAIEKWIQSRDPAWSPDALAIVEIPPVDPAPAPQPAASGAGGSMTIVEFIPSETIVGYVVPTGDYANVRPAPIVDDTVAPVSYKLPRGQGATVAETGIPDSNPALTWYRLRDGNYVRSDVVVFSVDRPAAPPTIPVRPPSLALYPAPAKYDRMNDFGGSHLGWDLLGEIGRPILSGPFGGTVVTSAYCQKCGPSSISAVSNGRALNDPQVFSDAAWQYGYGHHIIMRYDNNLLPAATHQFLSGRGWAGHHAFVMYAHLHAMHAVQGDAFTATRQIGDMGSSGNSNTPHLHLELRFGPKAQASWWARLKPGLADPGVLFAR